MNQVNITNEDYETFFNLNPDLACIASADGKFLKLNAAWEVTLGYAKEEMLTTSYLDFVHPKDIADTTEQMKKLSNGQTVINFQNRYRCKDGSYRWFDWNATPCSYAPLVYAIARDITESKKAKDDLKQREIELNEAQRMAHVGSWTLDVTTNHVFWTEELYRMYGLDPKLPPPDYSFHQTLFTKESWEKLSTNLTLTVEKGIPYELELEFITVNGKKGWMLVRGEAQKDAIGNIVILRGMAQDISELKKAQEKIHAQNMELNALNASKDKFFSIIAHDLRSPFTGFLGLTQLMAEKLDTMTIDEIKDFNNKMLKSANNLFSLLDNLLTWSRMQRGLIEIYPTDLVLSKLVNANIDELSETFIQKHISLTFTIPDDLHIWADAAMINSVIRNLISNAVKFTPRNGTISILAQKNGNDILFSIQDSGIGISTEMLNKLFKIDEKVSRLGTEGEASTGLGLLLCKDFLEKHNGNIWIESVVGKGSIFYFNLPQKNSSN
ncbi:MAG: PAS domain S-box protein [Leptospiraceae bacterium]|nr:PAS domain S-box protein [Leptospiraceae bacterium]